MVALAWPNLLQSPQPVPNTHRIVQNHPLPNFLVVVGRETRQHQLTRKGLLIYPGFNVIHLFFIHSLLLSLVDLVLQHLSKL